MFDPPFPWTIDGLFPDWRISGLLVVNSPVMDTGKSAQMGYVGRAIVRDDGGFSVEWLYESERRSKASGYQIWSSPLMVTSITWGTGLDLRCLEGRQRAIAWLNETGAEVSWSDETGAKHQLIADVTTLGAAVNLGKAVKIHADSVDPEWRVRYTPEWWARQGSSDK